MRTKKAFKNLVFNLVQQVIGIVTSFILPPLIIGKFGSAMNGLIATIKQIVSYAQLSGAGIASASTYAMYEPVAKQDHKLLSGIYNATGKMFVKAGNIFTITILVISMVYPFFVGNSISNMTVFLLVLIVGISGISEFYIFGKYQSLLNANQQNYMIALAQTIGNIFNIVITVCLIKLDQNIILVQLGASIVYIMRILLLTWYVKKNYSYLDKMEPARMERLNQRNDAIVHQVAGLVVLSSSTIIVSIFCGLQAASVYAVYALVFSGLNTICSIVSNAIYASFGEVIAKGDKKILNSAYNLYEWIYFVVIFIIFSTTYLLIMPFIGIYTRTMTDTNYTLPILGILFVVVGMANNLRVPARTLVDAAGHFRKTRNRALIEMTINLIGQIVCVSFMGIYGVLVGCILSYSYRTIDFIHYSNYYILKIDDRRSTKRFILNLFVAVVSVFILQMTLDITANSYFEWAIYGVFITVVITLVYMMVQFLVERETMKEMISVVKNMFKK